VTVASILSQMAQAQSQPDYNDQSREAARPKVQTRGPINMVHILGAALAVAIIALLVFLGLTIRPDRPAPTAAQSPTADAATVVPSDQLPPASIAPATPIGPAVTPEAFAGFVTTQQGGNVVVRAQPTQTGAEVTKLPHGAPLSVTGSTLMPDGLWRQVSIAGTIGYVKGAYVSQTQPAPIAKSVAPIAKMAKRAFWGVATTRSSDTVNVRSAPTTNASIMASIPYGASVYVLGEQGAWYLVEWNGRRGWTKSNYISEEDRD
jgi:uncharacterized protein YraI